MDPKNWMTDSYGMILMKMNSRVTDNNKINKISAKGVNILHEFNINTIIFQSAQSKKDGNRLEIEQTTVTKMTCRM